MRITICDDSIKDLLAIEKLVLKFKSQNPDSEFVLEKFSDSSRVSTEIAKGQFSDIYILDMLMPDRTGIDLGRQLRDSGCNNVIIFITASDDYALDAYGVQAIRYLLKPINEGKLFEALDYAMSYMNAKTEPLYLIKTTGGLVQRPYSKIEYIENAGRKLEVHLTDGEVLKSLFIRKSFEEEICEVADKNNFIQVHKSFLINMNYIQQLTPDCVLMESGAYLPVSKAKTSVVKREYLLFVSRKYR
ncbi:MAG: LytTR family DNA-binding domain-containing protein [Bacteroidales bacterium]|nr:LytTR family DNA-binding domain-containing protein [Bacteroidales bacterium]MCM1415366.1 LytTR family DNA-binding domain-containing protein [bacterium]MCM1423299.1 LytTR family DNA-binding domain-containing protein [bacterium]